MILAAILLSLIPLFRALSRLRSKKFRFRFRDDPDSATTIYIGLTILYTTVVACVAELGEGALMRAQVDPLILVALITFIRRDRKHP